MSDVSPINGVSSPALSPFQRPSVAAPTDGGGLVRGGDKVELSRAAQFISQLLSRNDVRSELVDRVRQELNAGTYETPEKVDAAFEELLKDL